MKNEKSILAALELLYEERENIRSYAERLEWTSADDEDLELYDIAVQMHSAAERIDFGAIFTLAACLQDKGV